MIPTSACLLRKAFNENSLRFFNNSIRNITSARNSEKLDPFQEALLKEQCILVNENDEEMGSASKREARHSGY